jgi:hypothetical protein
LLVDSKKRNLKTQIPIRFVSVVLLLSACAPIIKTAQLPTAAGIVLPTATKISSTQTVARTMDGLRTIIYASNPESPQYDPKSTLYAEFPEAVRQLSMMGSKAADAAGDLAIAITYPRQDSYLAAQTLIALGPDLTAITIVDLFGNLDSIYHPNQKPEALIYSLILLSSTGNRASCAVGNIGPLLWYPDPKVRSAAAFALEKITGQDLVANQYEIAITPSFIADSVSADTPEGIVVGAARQWWSEQGSKIKWHSSYGFCDP